MAIKFMHLQVGQAFVYEGEAYVKSSPLMGRAEATGQERLIPRSAAVEMGGERPSAPHAPTRDPIPAAEVLRAWRDFHGQINECAAELARRGQAACADELRRELTAAGAEFERKLGLNGSSELTRLAPPMG